MSKKTLSTLIQLVVFLGLGIGLIVWRYDTMNATQKEAMFSALGHVRWWWSGPVLIVGFLSHFFRALRWKLLLRPLEIYPSTANTTFAVLVGYLANTLVPRLGEVAKCTVLAKYENVPADKMVGTIIAERAFDLVCLILLLCVILILQYDIIYPYAQELYARIFLDDLGNFLWVRIMVAVGVLGVGFFLLIKLARRTKHSKFGKILKGIGEGLQAIGKIRQKGLFFLWTILVWAMYITLAIIGFWALPEMEHITLLAGLSVIVFGSVGMIATPGGIGAYPVIVAQVLLLYGIKEGVGLAYGWVSWAAQTAIVLLLGVLSLILLPLYNRQKYEFKRSVDRRQDR